MCAMRTAYEIHLAIAQLLAQRSAARNSRNHQLLAAALDCVKDAAYHDGFAWCTASLACI
jgi:hypothetical protein